jgi:hypothetical protein
VKFRGILNNFWLTGVQSGNATSALRGYPEKIELKIPEQLTSGV